MKSRLSAALFSMLVGFGLLGSAANAQGINACLDTVGKYQKLTIAANDRAGPNNCKAYTESLSWANKTIQQLKSCLSRAQRGRQTYHVEKAIEEMELGIKAARKAEIQHGCIADDWGTCVKQSGDVAVAACSRAISSGKWKEDDLAELYGNRANAWQAKGEFERSIADYDEVIRLAPRNADNFNTRCWARAIAGRDLQQALSDCTESLRLKPGNAAAMDSRGFVYLRLNRLEDATADYDAALKIDPRNAASLYGRGIVKLRKGDAAGGESDIAAAKTAQKDIAEEFAKYGVKPDVAAAAPAAPTPAPPPAADCARAETHWRSAEDIKLLAAYEDHLARFPTCDFAGLARARIEALKK